MCICRATWEHCNFFSNPAQDFELVASTTHTLDGYSLIHDIAVTENRIVVFQVTTAAKPRLWCSLSCLFCTCSRDYLSGSCRTPPLLCTLPLGVGGSQPQLLRGAAVVRRCAECRAPAPAAAAAGPRGADPLRAVADDWRAHASLGPAKAVRPCVSR